jgi:secondary thiamine-phosphate synthase enzyme
MLHELQFESLKRGLTEITGEVVEWVAHSRVSNGLCTLFLQHTSASLLIQENADPAVCRDLEEWLARLVVEGDPIFTHTSEGADDMPAHVKSALLPTSLSIPVRDGDLQLGTWQGVFLWEHRRHRHRRSLWIHLSSD